MNTKRIRPWLNEPIKLPVDGRGGGYDIEMSVQTSRDHYCGFRSSEVRFYGLKKCPWGWRKYMQAWTARESYNSTNSQVFTWVPDEEILKLSLRMGIDSTQLRKLKLILNISTITWVRLTAPKLWRARGKQSGWVKDVSNLIRTST